MQENKQEKSFIKQNILSYLKRIGVTPYECYKKTGITRGILTQNNGITEENILKFLAYYSDVDVIWLITGRDISHNLKKEEIAGEQKNELNGYKTEVKPNMINEPRITRYSCLDCIEKERTIQAQKKTIETQEKLIAALEDSHHKKNGEAV